MKIFSWKLLFLVLPFSNLLAQDFPLTPLSFTEWDKKGSQWNEVEKLTIYPFEDKIVEKQGKGELYASGKASLVSKRQFKDFKLEFEILQDQLTEASFSIGSNVTISLANSCSGTNPTIGSILKSDGNYQNSLQNVCKQTGLWQKIELIYKSPANGFPGVLEKLQINGVALFENYVVQNAGVVVVPISFKLDKGILGIRNVAFTDFGNDKPVSISNLNYKLEETNGWGQTFEKKNTPPIYGKSESLSHSIPNDYREFILTYTGDMNVAKAGHFGFTLDYQGVSQLSIDGKQVVGSKEYIYRVPSTGLVELSEGKHQFEFSYQRIWWPPGFGVFVSGADFRPYALHPANNLPAQEIVGGIYENPQGSKARTIRSFMNFKGEKRVKVISVGTPEKKHYSFDLNDGSLLYVWKGDFADVTEMWHERGEPQLLETFGETITLSGKPSFFQADSDEIVFKEYFLDKNGVPTYVHSLNNALVSQKMEPVNTGLEFTLTADNKEIKYLLAQSQLIEKLSPTLFKTNEYYIKLSKPSKVQIETKNGQMQLSGNANEIESYTLIW